MRLARRREALRAAIRTMQSGKSLIAHGLVIADRQHSVIWRRAQRSAGRQLLHTTQSFSGIGMAAACSPKSTNQRPKDGPSVKVSRSMSEWAPTYAPHVANADAAEQDRP
jgi:hypothetical protein